MSLGLVNDLLVFTSWISSFEPSSTIKVVVYRGFGTNINLLNALVVQYKGKVEDLLGNSEYNVYYVRVFVLRKV